MGEAYESLGTFTLVVVAVLVGLCFVMRWGWLEEGRSPTLGFGAIGIVILALTGYWGGELVYTFGIDVEAVMPGATP